MKGEDVYACVVTPALCILRVTSRVVSWVVSLSSGYVLASSKVPVYRLFIIGGAYLTGVRNRSCVSTHHPARC